MPRLEKDFLGTKPIPDDAYYGIQTARAAENFPITGQRLHPALIRALALVKKAAALANMKTGALGRRVGQAVVLAADEIISGQWLDQFIVDPIQGGAGTSINMNANEVIANRANVLLGGKPGDYSPVHPNNHVNMAQSTNDVVPTAVRIALLDLVKEAGASLEALADAFGAKAAEFDGIIKVGRTHLQDAVPILLGQEFAAYADAVRRDRERIERVDTGLYEVNMGATAVGTGLNADPAYIEEVVRELTRLTGYPLRRPANLVDATQNADVLVEVSGALKTAAVSLSKIASDLRLLASGPRAGLAEINLPPMQPGSSIMPGKVNPVIPEVVNQVAFQIMGNDLTVASAAGAGQLELNVMMPVLVYDLIQSVSILRNAVEVFRARCVEGISANAKRCRAMFEQSIGVVTAINPHVGYEEAARIAREALASGRSVRELVLERGILTEGELEAILSPEELTRPGIAGAHLLHKE